jgi:MinD-like ATPase involved in chromosome partitioning or flagellar assembly
VSQASQVGEAASASESTLEPAAQPPPDLSVPSMPPTAQATGSTSQAPQASGPVSQVPEASAPVSEVPQAAEAAPASHPPTAPAAQPPPYPGPPVLPPAQVTDPASQAPQADGKPEAPAARVVPIVTVAQGAGEEQPAKTVERALSGPASQRMRGWHDRVTLVPGGRRPGRSGAVDQEERDKARARLALPGPRRIVVLGCTSGAGQTVITLLTARLLASLRGETVGALDLNPGAGSLALRAAVASAGSVRDLLAGTIKPAANGRSGTDHLEVIGADPGPAAAKGLDERDYVKIGGLLGSRYGISLVDPGAAAVARVLDVADQLVLVAPASGDAPRAVSMTQEWLHAHDHRVLAASAVLVVNGVSNRSMPDVEQAEAIASGRCRAIVRVPWEDQLGAPAGPCAGGPLRLPARQALTALAGVLMSALSTGTATGDAR